MLSQLRSLVRHQQLEAEDEDEAAEVQWGVAVWALQHRCRQALGWDSADSVQDSLAARWAEALGTWLDSEVGSLRFILALQAWKYRITNGSTP